MRPNPALINGPPHRVVKEQGPGVYAQEMARHGFVAIAFDPSGESGGEPRPLPTPPGPRSRPGAASRAEGQRPDHPLIRENPMTMSSLSARIGDPRPFAMDIDHRRGRGRGRRVPRGVGVLLGLLALGGCEAGQAATSGSPAAVAAGAAPPTERPEESRMWMTVGERRFAINLTDDPAARAFAAQLPLTLNMSELNGNEKHADLREALPAHASRPGTIRSGDLMLYGTKTLVLFYATFNSSYPYTRLGRVDDPTGLPQVLGRRGVRIVFSDDQLPDPQARPSRAR
jgi:hypothetical protein